MTQVYADTVFWIALLSPRDSLHRKSLALSNEIPPDSIVTSEMVLTEVLSSMGKLGPLSRGAAAGMVEAFAKSANTVVVPQTTEQFHTALQMYKRSIDKEWSLTDCASFLIMEEHGIRAALTHDLHFVQAGFDALLR